MTRVTAQHAAFQFSLISGAFTVVTQGQKFIELPTESGFGRLGVEPRVSSSRETGEKGREPTHVASPYIHLDGLDLSSNRKRLIALGYIQSDVLDVRPRGLGRFTHGFLMDERPASSDSGIRRWGEAKCTYGALAARLKTK